MEHHFNLEFATKFGVNEAIFCHNLYFWIKKNQANGKHFYEGRFWTYNSNKAFGELFPYWSTRQIRTVIENCEKKNLIIKGNFNKQNYDQTLWFALTDISFEIYEPKTKEELVKIVCQRCETVGTIDLSELTNGNVKIDKWNCQKCQMELSELTNGIDESDKPIPDNKPYNKPYKDKNLVNKDVNKNQEIIDSIILEYMKQGLSKELCHRVVNGLNFDGIKNLERYLYGVFEKVLYSHNLRHGKIEVGSIEGTPLYDWYN